MAEKPNLTENECIDLVQFVCDTFRSKNIESAVAAIIERIRITYDVSCVTVREVFSRPYSLVYTYESVSDSEKFGRINETVKFGRDVWVDMSEKFYEKGYICMAEKEDGDFQPFTEKNTIMPKCVIQASMYYNKAEFFGVLELADFDEIRCWNECEKATLKICADFICQRLYRIHSSSVKIKGAPDPVTGLMNFTDFTELLDRQISEIPQDFQIAVVYVDIQHFKYINEKYGYKKGNEVLKFAAQAIYDEISKYSDIIICRVYADNFVSASLIPDSLVPGFAQFIKEQNVVISQKLQNICPGVSIRIDTGICYVNDGSISATTAVTHANLARKTAKRENMKKPFVFSNEMMEDIKYQEYLNNELPKAIANREFKVYYQPKISCADETLSGAEALIRWQKPDGKFIYPDQFIPVFEKNGNIMEVDFYVYREVFRYLRERMDKGLPLFPISMNVSRVHFRSNKIIPYIEKLMKEYKVPAKYLEFELTENIYMNNFNTADNFINTCREYGIHTSMDDFGSGYSSLNIISTLNIDEIKIDKIFLKNHELSDNDKIVLESMIGMAKRIGMKVVCEGVETKSQADFLKSVQCDRIQGYYYGKPMDEESFNLFAEKMPVKSTV
ncbi:MAG: bifunctional diguanylate cyclase/phosphodiesterase [Oscillospiraceae bacterium]|nr:bifunctional diguanylate cyclase/phosphodiesterase [Oscillospiraceae bacterium]